MKVIERFLNAADDNASKVALWDEERSYTYHDLKRAIDIRAHHIMISSSSENVGILLATGVDFVTSYFGALLAGKTPVPINYLLSSREIQRVVMDSQVDCVLTSEELSHVLGAVEINSLIVEHFETTVSKLTTVQYPATSPYAALLYTSGTEGIPKGVPLSDLNLLANLAGCKFAIDFDESFIILGTLPLFHGLALTTTMLLPLLEGATAVYTGKFDAGAVLAAIDRRKANTIVSVPALYRALLLRSGAAVAADTSSLTLAISGGQGLPESVLLSFRERFGLELLSGYGLTETSPVVSVNTLKENRAHSVGKPLHNVQVKIIDEALRMLARDTDGEICVEGLSVTDGYFHQPELTRRSFTSDRYLRTGDIGRLDADGFLYVTGRRSDMMIVGGENVFPQEIEEVISSHPAVLEAAVAGVPDEARGEIPKAFVVVLPGQSISEQEIKDQCRAELPRHMVPRDVMFLEELPKTATGKVLRRQLIDLYG